MSLSSGPEALRKLWELFAQTGLLGEAVNKEQGKGGGNMGSSPSPTLSAMEFQDLPTPGELSPPGMAALTPALPGGHLSDHRCTLITNSLKTPVG